MCAVETSDLFLPQCMLLEKGVQYVDEDGNPNLVTDEHAEVIDYIRSMINDGVCEIAPGGGVHTEEWYGTSQWRWCCIRNYAIMVYGKIYRLLFRS